LKKQLKQELTQELKAKKKKNKKLHWGLIFLLFVLLIGGGYCGYVYYIAMVPQLLLERGIKLEVKQQPIKASDTYQKIVDRYPVSSQAEEALYRRGKIWQYDRHDVKRALLSYMTLELKYPKSHLLKKAEEEAAHIIKYSLHDYSRAIVYYQRLYRLGGTTAADYLYEIADCYFYLENYPQARIELDSFLEYFPDSERVPEVLLRKGELALLEKHYDNAEKTWQKLIEEYPLSQYRFDADFKLAELLEERGLLHAALAKYREIKNFPRPPLLNDKIKHLEKRIAAKDKVK
jgi:TolA-binding protein